MQANLTKRVDQLVEMGWQPVTTTETTVSLVGRRPFNWWLFLFVIIFFPVFGGMLYLIFWLATSRATIFLHEENGAVVTAGDLWLVQLQEVSRDAYVKRQREIKERGFLAVMWPQLIVFLLFLALWIYLIKIL